MFLLNFFSRSKSKNKQIGKDKNIETSSNPIIPELQTENYEGLEDETDKIHDQKQVSQLNIRLPSQDTRPELTESSTPLHHIIHGTPNNQSAKDRSNFIGHAFSSHDNSVILKDSINKNIYRRPKANTAVSADKGQERGPGKYHHYPKPNRPKIPRVEIQTHARPELPVPSTYLKPLKIQPKKQDLSRERERKPEVRAEQMFQRSENYVKRQQQSIARTLREIGSYEKNPTEPKPSVEPASHIPKKREASGTPLRDRKDISVIVEDRFGTPAKEFFRESGSGRNSYNNNNNPKKLDSLPNSALKKKSVE